MTQLTTEELKQKGAIFLTLDKQVVLTLIPNEPVIEMWNASGASWTFGSSIKAEFVPFLIDALKRAHHEFKAR